MEKKHGSFPFTWFPPTLTPNKCANNQSAGTIDSDTENVTLILNLQIQNLATEIKAVNMFAKE